MKRNVLFAAIATVAICSTASAQEVKPLEDNRYLITTGNVQMTVNAAEGGKVISYKYDEQEMLSQLRMQNQYGSTFWTSPQKEWNWPPVAEIDRQAYEGGIENGVLTLKSKVARKVPFSITKKYQPGKKSIKITYTITNEGDAARQVAPWEISRVISSETGLIFFDAPVSQIEAAQGDMIPFQGLENASWYNFEETRANRKINSDGKGWLAYAQDGLLMIKKFDDITPDQPAPGEAEIQIYVNAGKTYIELESQGAYKTLEPGQSLDWSVDWILMPVKDATPSKALLKTVRKSIKKIK